MTPHDALAMVVSTGGFAGFPVTQEVLALLALVSGNQQEPSRLYGAADEIRERTGQVRFAIFDAIHEGRVCPPTRYSPTSGAAAVGASDPRAGGRR